MYIQAWVANYAPNRMRFITAILGNRIAQMIFAVLLTAVVVGGYSWWQKQIVVAELNKNIQVLTRQAKEKTADRKRYAKQKIEANEAIETNNEKTFVDYWNDSN